MKYIFRILFILLYKIFGFIFILPLSFIVSKQKNLIVFLGRAEGKFVDNVKYMQLYLHHMNSHKIVHIFLSSNNQTVQNLKTVGINAVLYPSLTAFYILLKAKVAFVDTSRFMHEFKAFFLTRCNVVQLWHGPPIKEISLNAFSIKKIFSFSSFQLMLYNFIRDWLGSRYVYSIFCSPSQYYSEKIFKQNFHSDLFLNSGQPRNDDLASYNQNLVSLETDQTSINQIIQYKKQGFNIIFYLPTFRDGENIPLKSIQLTRFSDLAQKNKCLWVIKLHPNVKKQKNVELIKLAQTQNSNVILYNQNKDIYACLDLADILVTDYSSIYLDFLFFDKPIIFFNYDYEKYTKFIRGLAFNYEEMTPGPKCHNHDDLDVAIKKILSKNNDMYREQRLKVFNKVFDYHDRKSAERIWLTVQKNYL